MTSGHKMQALSGSAKKTKELERKWRICEETELQLLPKLVRHMGTGRGDVKRVKNCQVPLHGLQK